MPHAKRKQLTWKDYWPLMSEDQRRDVINDAWDAARMTDALLTQAKRLSEQPAQLSEVTIYDDNV